ncbi:hypothetical protein [Alteromonas macleodii]|uniref:hypothetical protein n=1 Tax=Alteromonas macleodii TaxID=28108 RepID=UPI0031404E6E
MYFYKKSTLSKFLFIGFCTSSLIGCGGEDERYKLEVNITGLSSGSIVLESSIGEMASLSSNGIYQFNEGFESLSEASVQIVSQPSDKLCEINDEEIQDRTKTVYVGCYGAPSPSLLSVSYDTKKIILEWENNSTKYVSHTVLIRRGENEGFTPVVEDILESSYELLLNSYQFVDAEVIIKSCNSLGCAESTAEDLSDDLTEVIGFFEAENEEENFYFGKNIALSRESSVLAVSSSRKLSEAQGEKRYSFGDVYLYSLANGAPVEAGKLNLANPALSFGSGIGISNDGSVITVLGEAVSQTDPSLKSNAVYIYKKQSDDSWLLFQTIVLSNIKDWQLGSAVALSYSGSVIAITSFSNGEHEGRTIVLEKGADDIYHSSIVQAPSETNQNTGYGTSISISGDGRFFVVGAPREDQRSIDTGDEDFPIFTYTEGAAFIYEKVDEEWRVTSKLKSSNPRIDDAFGTALTISNDGKSIAVGSPGGEGATGKVEIFTNQSEIWNLTQNINSPSASTNSEDLFGYSLAFSQSGDELFVGAPGEGSDMKGISKTSSQNTGSFDSGAVYYYRLNSEERWENNVLIKSKFNHRYEMFGKVVVPTDSGSLIITSFNYPAPVGERNDSPGGFYIY